MTKLTAAWGDWLGEYKWTHASTLTFRGPRGLAAARRAVQRHFRDLARRVHRKVPWFWVMERTHQGHIHVHTLIEVPLSSTKVRQSWQGGRAKVELYDSKRGWRHYITKEIGETAVDWDISRWQRSTSRAEQAVDTLADGDGGPE